MSHLFYLKLMKYIKEIGAITKEKDMVKISILMDPIMKVNG